MKIIFPTLLIIFAKDYYKFFPTLLEALANDNINCSKKIVRKKTFLSHVIRVYYLLNEFRS